MRRSDIGANVMFEDHHVGFTGTQKGTTQAQFRTLRRLLDCEKPDYLHHGDCIGADFELHLMADAMGVPVVLHPPTKTIKRRFVTNNVYFCWPPAGYLQRNQSIVRNSNLLYACPSTYEEELRSGTWSTIRYARKQEKTVVVVFPDGTFSREERGNG